MTDWQQWHAPYEDPGSALSARLRAVQQELVRALDRAAPGPVRLLSLCAGRGRDVLPVLAAHPRGADVAGRLVELDPRNAAVARAAAPAGLEVVEGDAGASATVGALPVDVLLLCGIFGNVEDEDVERTVRAVPGLLAQGGTVLWTRHRSQPDLTPAIRGWLSEQGVEEAAFVAGGERGWAVGAGVLRSPHLPQALPERLFTFSRRPPEAPAR